MLIAQKKIWFAAVVVATALMPLAAFADGKNEIRAVAFSEDPSGTTLVRVRGAQTPTFTVYKLERPSRVVVDVPQARLAEALRGHEGATVFMPSTWAVSTIAAQQLDDGGQIVRVIVTMARPGRYDVKTENNEVVVMVTARDPMPPKTGANAAELAKAQADADAAKKAAAHAEQMRVAAEKASASAQAEAERLRKAAADQTARASAAQKAADDATRAGQASAADIERAKKMADSAKAEAMKAKQDATRAQGEADRMRVAAEQSARDAKAEADRARKEADDAKQIAAAAKQDVARTKAEAEAAKKAALADMQRSKAEVAAAKQEAQAAKDAANKDVARTKAEADRARQEADVAKLAAQRDVANAQRTKAEADAAMQAAQRDVARTKAEADAAKQAAQRDVARTKAEADAAKVAAQQDVAAMKLAAEKDIARTRAEAERAKRDAAAELAAANQAKAEAEAARREAEQARSDAAKIKDAAARTKLEAEATARLAQADAAKVKAEADAAKTEAARTKAEANLARSEAEAARRDVAMKRAEADAAKNEATRAKDDAARTSAEIARARSEAEAAKADAARARSDAKVARAEADAAKAAAAAEKRQAEADKQRAEAERVAAMAMQKDAKTKLAALDKKAADVQALDDKARAAHAAAQAREEAARAAVAQAEREIAAAELAAKTAAAARDRSTGQVAADKAKLIAQAKEAEDRLAKAKSAADAAEARRSSAETAAANAKKDLESTRTTLATVEGQRTAAERAASEAARKRSEAEAAANEAAERKAAAESAVAIAAKQRQDAERAAAAASKQRTEAEQQRIAAEQQRKAAEDATRDAQAAKVAADKQRVIAENAAKSAVSAKHSAESSLEVLMAKREAAERAAAELEVRSKAEAKAQAALALAQQRKVTDDEMAKAKKEADRLAKEREQAEGELADRRKAVAMQQAEAERLKSTAMQARDAAEREEKRRAQLAQQRAVEEQELAQIKARKDKATADAAKVVVAPPAPEPKVAVKVAPKAAFIKDVTFKGSDGAGRVDIALAGEGQISVGEVTATAVELIIDNAELGAKLERKLDVSRYGSPVRAVSSFRDRRTPNRVRLIAELSSPATPTLERDASGVKWSFVSTQTAQAAKPMRTQHVPSPVVGGFGAASTPIAQQSVSQVAPQAPRNRKVYRGAIIDFDYKDAPMADLLRTIADTGKVNIVVPDGIDARVTVRLKKVPWDQALEVILASHGLWYRRDGNLYRIAPRKELDAEDELEAARREAAIKAETPRTDVIPLNYASAGELKGKLEAMLSPKGRIEVDDRTNSLIVNDVAGNREQISRLALQLDRQTPQISIEARIVEARSTFQRQFGIQWGGRANASAAGGNATGLVWPSSIGIAGGAEDNQTPRGGVATPSDFAINLPAAVGTGAGGALGVSLGSVGGNFNINLRLSAAEDEGTVRIISAPKITVLNNKEAKISQGVSIPISVVSAAGTQTQFVQADLALTVKPYVSQRDCAIAMDLTVTKNEPDFVNTGARGDPSILRKEAKTSMLVADGETSVLGGIYTRNTGLSYSKFPFLADIPVLGWLFKTRRENDDRTEILVFITPKITNRGLLGCQ
jgi:type IV pilus assembly protein PilQ